MLPVVPSGSATTLAHSVAGRPLDPDRQREFDAARHQYVERATEFVRDMMLALRSRAEDGAEAAKFTRGDRAAIAGIAAYVHGAANLNADLADAERRRSTDSINALLATVAELEARVTQRDKLVAALASRVEDLEVAATQPPAVAP